MNRLLKATATTLPPARRLLAERQTLLAEQDRLRAQLAASRPVYDEAALRYVFVFTYGRSGSTLLQGILNAVPGVLVRGENGNALYSLYTFRSTLVTYRQTQSSKVRELVPTDAWWGIDGYPDDVALRGIRRLALDTVIRPEADSRLVGYKEIRWADHKDLADYVAFLRGVFPGAKFLLNTRDHTAVSKSKWWAERPDAFERLARAEGRLTEVAAGLGEHAFHVHYDDYRDNPEALRGMHEWLGIDYDEARVRAVMDTRHSY